MKAFSSATGITIQGLCALTLIFGSPAVAQAPYGVGAYYLGDDYAKVKSPGNLRCTASKFFSSFRWCGGSRKLSGSRGNYTEGTGIMHSANGRIVYASRIRIPAHFPRDWVKLEIRRLSQLYGKARVLRAPKRISPAKGIIVYWGNVTLAAVDERSRSMLARGQSPRKGILIDFLGNFRKSVRLGLPVYAYRGGAGFVWRAAVDENGRGRLRFAAVDASAYMSSAISHAAAAAARRNSAGSRGSEFSTAPRRQGFSSAPRRSEFNTAPRGRETAIPPQRGAIPGTERRRIARAAPPQRRRGKTSSGTGFFINKGGMLVTNAHVVNGCSDVKVKYRSNPPLPATVVARDRRNDLAILKTGIRSADFSPLRLKVELGEAVAAFGYPLASLLSKSGNFSLGNVTSLAGVSDDIRKLQISVPVQPGNSGGPLLDYQGNVVGVVTSKLNALKTAKLTGDVPQNVNFAIKSTMVSSFLDSNGASYASKVLEQKLTATELAKKAKSISAFITCR